jgi:hypothetical protein
MIRIAPRLAEGMGIDDHCESTHLQVIQERDAEKIQK